MVAIILYGLEYIDEENKLSDSVEYVRAHVMSPKMIDIMYDM